MEKYFLMKLVKFILLINSILILGCNSTKKNSNISSEEKNKTLIFPNDYTGIYKGTLFIKTLKGKQEIPMEYHLKKTDSSHKYEYSLIYNNQPRNYTLVIKDQKKGLFNIDENNGIILPSYYHKNTLHSFFEVQGNLLNTRMEFLDDKVAFEIIFTPTLQKIKTGGIADSIPEVYGYPITVFQTATLIKQL